MFVSNLSFGVDEEMLKDFLQQNKARAIKIVLMRNETGQSKGVGIIEFSSSQDAEYVVKALNGVDFEGRAARFEFQRQR